MPNSEIIAGGGVGAQSCSGFSSQQAQRHSQLAARPDNAKQQDMNPGAVSVSSTFALAVILATTMPRAAGEDISVRIEKAGAVLDKLDDCLGICLQREDFAGVDCAAVIPHFYRGAAVSGEVFKGGLLLEMFGDN